jgi:hypothetical protein
MTNRQIGEDMNLAELYGPNLTTFLDDSSGDSSGLGDDREQVRRLAGLSIDDPARSYVSIHLMSAHRAGFRFGSAKDKATRYFGGQELVKRLMPNGSIPINLFDAMRVIAERVERPS